MGANHLIYLKIGSLLNIFGRKKFIIFIYTATRHRSKLVEISAEINIIKRENIILVVHPNSSPLKNSRKRESILYY